MFSAPLVLLGLLALPGLYFLLRLTPPAARRVRFPPLALLRGLAAVERTPARMPLWLLALRLLIAALVIVGLAGPQLHPPPALPGSGPVLLVIDNGWASASDWAARRDAALQVVAGAGQAGRGVSVLATTRDASNAAPRVQGVMPAVQAAQMLAAMVPEPWPVDRAGAAQALHGPTGDVVYVADGITDGPGFAAFMAALHPSRILSDGVVARLLAAPHLLANGDVAVRLAAGVSSGRVLAQTAAGDVLASAAFADGEAHLALPVAVRNKLARLVLTAPASAGGTLLLDSTARGGMVGLLASAGNAEAPFLGSLYYVRRAVPVGSAIITGDVTALLAAKVNVIIAADVPFNDTQIQMLQGFVRNGGVLIRFAGPLTADAPDTLTPDVLLAGERRLGGALTWSAPQNLAPFAPASPFAGLPPDTGVSVSRQILADPTQLNPATVWASLHDGTPLVLGRSLGAGYLVSVLTSANTEWSDLALSGLYPAMLGRLVQLAQGAPPKPDAPLPLMQALDGFGGLATATRAAHVTAQALPELMVSPEHPPGLYGSGAAMLALNVGGHVPRVVAAALPGAVAFDGTAAPVPFGSWLLAAALVMLAVDLMISLLLRGLLRLRGAVAVVLLLLATAGHADAQDAALGTTLGYVLTGDAATDQITADGMSYLSALVSAHTSAQLGAPVGLTPGVDDISLYPMIYWPILPGTVTPSAAACAAFVSYMQHGGLLVIDTPGGDAGTPGSGAGFAPGAADAVQRDTACLNLPQLQPLTTANVLAHCFYIVSNFPGRFVGAPVLIANEAARDADGVSPVIVAQNDWAGAWARDNAGNPEQTPLPGGDDQRILADRFGTNLVIYALTGSYKADQSSLPALLNQLSAP
ncbi:MAG: hypothetical protein B7W99_01845 [Rhodospirillales bacterium 20-58-10]|nr:MAG: hypothetical protein B7W99_01845 [Rhodospirillales bacterium 20-58-10]